MRRKFLILLLSVAVFFYWNQVSAEDGASLYFRVTPEKLDVGAVLKADVLLSAPTLTNVFDVTVEYSKDTLQIEAFDTSGSIINLWKDGPRIPDTNTFNILGGSLKGFSGPGGKLITLYFKVRAPGPVSLVFKKSNIYSADGRGTLLKSSVLNFKKEVGKGIAPQDIPFNYKAMPPMALNIIKNNAEDSRLLFWTFGDMVSNLKKTEVRFLSWFSWGEWRESAGPVKVPDSAWGVEVRAVDLTGSMSSKIIYTIPPAIKTVMVYAFVTLVIVLVLKFTLRRLRTRHLPFPLS